MFNLSNKLWLVALIIFTLSILSSSVSLIQAQEPEPLPDHLDYSIPEGHIIIEGDIVVPEHYLTARSAWNTNFWPNGIVPYRFDDNVSASNQQAVLNAMAEITDVANVTFVLRTVQENFITIRNSTVNNSQVGMVGGEQIINIVSWGEKFIIVHELMHALGFWHEQSRPDRDKYVAINWIYIESGLENNFEIADSADVYPKDYYGLPDEKTYDFGSLMHYGQCAFSIATSCPPGETITVKPPNQLWQSTIGQREKLSDLDKLTLSFLYPEDDWKFLDTRLDYLPLGTFQNPYVSVYVALGATPFDGTVWIQPGTYSGDGIHDRPLTLQAPLGNVFIGD